jgi:hypothetical protein
LNFEHQEHLFAFLLIKMNLNLNGLYGKNLQNLNLKASFSVAALQLKVWTRGGASGKDSVR